jgi:uncharacterized protein YqgV (UPF0045/DUF77 family)
MLNALCFLVVQFSLLPISATEPSMAHFIAASVAEASRAGLKHHIGPSSLTIEGPLDVCFEAIQRTTFTTMNQRNLQRMVVTVQADVKVESEGNRINKKIAAVTHELNRMPH